jgi:hypothetical protein
MKLIILQISAFRNDIVVGVINNMTTYFPDFPPLTQPEDIDESIFCDKQKCIRGQPCYCVHRLKVKKDSIVEIVMIDEAKSEHAKLKIEISHVQRVFIIFQIKT